MAGVSVLSLCEKGDAYIAAETGKIFKKEKEMKKGQHVAVLSSSVSRIFLQSWFKPLNLSLCSPPHHRYCFSYLCVGEQLRLPFLSFEERPGHHSEGRGPCQNVSTYATALTCLFSPVFVFPQINRLFFSQYFYFLPRFSVTRILPTVPSFLVIWAFTSMASSQTWLTASLSE